jgi:hypothetical protein
VLGGRGAPRPGQKLTPVGGPDLDQGTVMLPAATPPPPPPAP